MEKTEQKQYAEVLYYQRIPQKEIAARVGVSVQTLTRWKSSGNWEAKRSARAISRDTLIAKTMARMNEMLDKGEDFNADAFAKAAKQLKDLQRGATLDDTIEVLTAFGDWLLRLAPSQPEVINTAFVQTLTRLQDDYIQEKLAQSQQ